jgi:hypothetical protein
MKGFLQRVATNAVRPQAGIHPLAGSIYAGPMAQTPRDVVTEPDLPEEERLVASPQPDQHGIEDPRVEPRGPLTRVREARKRGDAQPDEAFGRRGESFDAQLVSFRPLLGKADVRNAERRYRAAAHSEGPDESDGAIEGAEPLRTRERKSGPVLPREFQGAFAIHQGYRAASDAFRRSAAEREPDRVEIHIGRIEVTAVPQETPRPPATRPRKSLDLGEYLKRRDGRTG